MWRRVFKTFRFYGISGFCFFGYLNASPGLIAMALLERLAEMPQHHKTATPKLQKEMNIHQYLTSLIVLPAMAFFLLACQEQEKHHEKIEPAHIEHIEGSELSLLKLSEKAVERIGIQAVPVAEQMIAHSEPRMRLTVPYSALLYDVQGRAWVYTNPEPQTYLRHEVEVDFITGETAVLNAGPPAGARVVSVGAAELYGTEYEVGH